MESGSKSDSMPSTESSNFPESSRFASIPYITPKNITRWLLREILRRQNTKVILVMGILRPGKSSLVESITGATGLSGRGIRSVTGEYQLTSVSIEGENYIFVDTPGFADPDKDRSDEAVYRNIMEFIELVQGAVTIVGILFVHKIGAIYTGDVTKTFEILKAFAGVEYFPFITFVTTCWDMFKPKGAMIYHHGKVYNGTEATGEVLDMEEQGEMRREQAQKMITRHYKDRNFSMPLVVEELKKGRNIDDTSAARVIGIRSQTLQVAACISLPSQSGTSAEHNQTPGPNWLDMLKSLLWGTGRRFYDHIINLLPRLPLGTSWYPRYSQRMGVEIVLILPIGPRIVIGLHDSGFPIIYSESDSEDVTRTNNILEAFQDDITFGIEPDEVESEISDREDLDNRPLDGPEFMREFEEARNRHESDESGWGFCIIL
ncbi:hypothetical protein B7463_g10203, partial [Scytalidium lignicola]